MQNVKVIFVCCALFNQVLAAIIAKLVVAGVVSLISADLLYTGYLNRRNERLHNKTVEKGTRPDVMISEDEFVKL